MTYPELCSLVARLSYRPGWTMRVVEGGFWGPKVEITAEVPDTYAPERTVAFRTFAQLPPLGDLTEDWVLNSVGWGLKEAEIHESREWFKLDGKIIDDPHAEPLPPPPVPARLMAG